MVGIWPTNSVMSTSSLTVEGFDLIHVFARLAVTKGITKTSEISLIFTFSSASNIQGSDMPMVIQLEEPAEIWPIKDRFKDIKG